MYALVSVYVWIRMCKSINIFWYENESKIKQEVHLFIAYIEGLIMKNTLGY